jgi:hypothetical protein
MDVAKSVDYAALSVSEDCLRWHIYIFPSGLRNSVVNADTFVDMFAIGT